MNHRLGLLALAALACGDSSGKARTETVAHAASPDPSPLLTLIDSCSVPVGAEDWCKSCIATPMPHCADQPIPTWSGGEPAACANAACEVPASETVEPLLDLSGGLPMVLQGQCADGKTFEAQLTVSSGHITYQRDGAGVGTVQYHHQIGDCACGGQRFSGDVVCASPTAELPDGGSLPSALTLPFADGKRPSTCFCAD